MTTDEARLRRLIDIWAITLDDAIAVLHSLDETDWDRPTACPGWTVRDVAAHLAHLESDVAGLEQPSTGLPDDLPHVTSAMSLYTEMGVIARRDQTPAALVDELKGAFARRLTELRADRPDDATAPAPRTPGGVELSWETLLTNRPFDVWLHEQDIRRAVGRPGGLDGVGAGHTVGVFARAFGYVVGKRVKPPAGTTVVLDVTGVHPVHLVARVGEDGRAALTVEEPETPSASVRLSTEAFTLLGAGRVEPASVDAELDGDNELGQRVLASMNVTP